MTIMIISLAILFVIAGLGNLSGHPKVIQLYKDMKVDPRLRFVAGTVELLGGIGLLTPLEQWAAIGLCLFMGVAFVVHILVKDPWLKAVPSLLLMMVMYYVSKAL